MCCSSTNYPLASITLWTCISCIWSMTRKYSTRATHLQVLRKWQTSKLNAKHVCLQQIYVWATLTVSTETNCLLRIHFGQRTGKTWQTCLPLVLGETSQMLSANCQCCSYQDWTAIFQAMVIYSFYPPVHHLTKSGLARDLLCVYPLRLCVLQCRSCKIIGKRMKAGSNCTLETSHLVP